MRYTGVTRSEMTRVTSGGDEGKPPTLPFLVLYPPKTTAGAAAYFKMPCIFVNFRCSVLGLTTYDESFHLTSKKVFNLVFNKQSNGEERGSSVLGVVDCTG